MVTMPSEKPICAPPHLLEMSPPLSEMVPMFKGTTTENQGLSRVVFLVGK